MPIHMYNRFSVVKEEDIALSEYLNDALAIPIPGAQYSEKFKLGIWDGYHRYFNIRNKVFPTGLLWKVQSILDEYNIPVIDCRGEPPQQDLMDRPYDFSLVGIDELFDHQKKAVTAALDNGRGTIGVSTRGGKTEIFASILANLWSQNAVLLYGQRHLLVQTAERLSLRLDAQKSNEDVSIIMGGTNTYNPDRPGRKITLISVPKAVSDYKRTRTENAIFHALQNANVLIIDECQSLAARTWYRLAMSCNAYYRFALSDTSEGNTSKDALDIAAATDKHIYRAPIKELIDKELVAKPYVIMVNIDRGTHAVANKAPYTQHVTAGIQNNDYRNDVIINIAKAIPNQTMIIVDRIKHGKMLSEALDAPFLYGDSSLAYRKEIIEKFDNLEIPIVIANTKVAGVGLDIKNINYLIYAAGGNTYTKVSQATARALTRQENKKTAIIIDFLDRFSPQYLLKNSHERKEIYLSRGYENLIITSPEELMIELQKYKGESNET